MNRLTAGMLCVAGLSLATVLGGTAAAQLAQNSSGPIDLSANSLELIDTQHLAVWRGDVDAIRGPDRLRSDVLNIYFSGKPGQEAASASSGGAAPGRNWGKVDHMVAEGHVFFVSPTQNARSDHAVYELAPDTITMTGDVIVEQGESVIHGQRLVIDVKSGHATMASAAETKTPSGRVRGIFYPNEASQNGSARSQ
jgi:lipopolysaccharide export system protein LptA